MSNPIDTKVISKLAEILDKNQLTGLNYEDETCKISLTRDAGSVSTSSYTPTIIQPVTAVAPAPVASVAEPESAPLQEDYASSPNAVKSPMVGVVYLSSNPNAPAYVKEGDSVAAGDTVCLIEAMKTYNPVKAHKGGRVSKILVESGDPVEYGAPLIIIE
jgi:acetyl-CoA carboxylase biotin carboxyl carrier protein